MEDFELNLTGMEELEEKLTKAVKLYPDQVQTTLEVMGKQFKKRVITISKEVGIKKRTGNLNKGYKVSKVTGYGINMQVEFRATAPHFHLLEKGHEKIIKGENRGFVPGRYMVKKTRKEYEVILPIETKKMADNIIKESGLS